MNERAADIEAKETEKTVRHLKSQAKSLSDDIRDYIEENPGEEHKDSLEDIDKHIARIEDLRSVFRNKHKELINHCHPDNIGGLERSFGETISEIKEYLKDLKGRRKSLRDNEVDRKFQLDQNRASKVKFINEEVRRIIASFNDIFS